MRKIDDETENEDNKNDSDEKENVDKVKKWSHYRKRKPKIGAIEMDDAEKVAKEPPKAVLFVPYTVNSELASQIKKVIQDLRPWTRLNIKVVERCGLKLEDMLCKSNP